MELSRLSNSLGSVCSQRRRPAGGCSGPSPAPSLFEPPPPPPLLSNSLPPQQPFFFPFFVCVCFLFHCAHERAPPADPAAVLCSLVSCAAPCPLTPVRSPVWAAAQWSSVLSRTLAPSRSPPSLLQPEERAWLWHGA